MIHLIHDLHLQIDSGPLNTRRAHFAIQCVDIEGARARLAQAKIETVERTLPDHGYQQIFFRDPDGNVIEIGEWPDVQDMVALLETQARME